MSENQESNLDIINDEDVYDEDDTDKSFIVEAHKGVNVIGEKGNAFVKIDITGLVSMPLAINMVDSFHHFVSTLTFSKAIFNTRFALEKFKSLKLYVLAEVPMDALNPTVRKALSVKDIVIFQKGKSVSKEEFYRRISTTFNLEDKKDE